jgi:TonB family protein
LRAAALGQNAPAPVTDEPLKLPPIVYPAEAKKARIEGTVVLEIKVAPTGEVTSVEALSGPIALRQAAIDAYSHATYKPLLKNGIATPADITTSVNFKLKELPPDTDQQIDQAFEPLHARCQTLYARKDPEAVDVCQKALDMANRFSPNFEKDVHATAYNDLVLALIDAKQKPEAARLGDEAVARFVDPNPAITHHSGAAATAYITRAEIRSLNRNPKGSAADCAAAEEIIRSLLQDEAEVDKAANYRNQLRETMLLHAVVLEQMHKDYEAKKLREQARFV